MSYCRPAAGSVARIKESITILKLSRTRKVFQNQNLTPLASPMKLIHFMGKQTHIVMWAELIQQPHYYRVFCSFRNRTAWARVALTKLRGREGGVGADRAILPSVGHLHLIST